MAEAVTQADQVVIVQDALQNKIQEYFKVSSDLDKWILHVSDKKSKGLQLLKRPAQAGARAYKVLESLISEVYDMKETWLESIDVPVEEINFAEDSPYHDLIPDRLDELLAGWEAAISNSQPAFGAFKSQDALAAAELGLDFLGESYHDALNRSVSALENGNNMVVDAANVSKNDNLNPSQNPFGQPNHRSTPDYSQIEDADNILNVSSIERRNLNKSSSSGNTSSFLSPEVLLSRISESQIGVENKLARLSGKANVPNPARSTEEGLRELKYDLKESKEAQKILDNIDALVPAEQDKVIGFREWRQVELAKVEYLIDGVMDKREDISQPIRKLTSPLPLLYLRK